MIRALIFDCFGVFYPDPVMAYTHNPKASPENSEALHSFDDQAARGNLSKASFVRQTARLLGRPEDETERHFFHSANRNQALVAFVGQARQHYKVALLSNIGSDMMDGFFTPIERERLFDAVVLSGDVRIAKPDPAIYKLTCDRLGVDPSESVMIDDIQRNVDAAKSLGMQGIAYKNFEQLETELRQLLGSNIW